jgi:hypothetical protein
MGTRSRPSFNKRQKEHARQEKQREKAQRKQQRKLEKTTAVEGGEAGVSSPEPEQQQPAPGTGGSGI